MKPVPGRRRRIGHVIRYARAAFQAECGNTTWFPGAVALLTGLLLVCAAMTKDVKDVTVSADVVPGPTSSQELDQAAGKKAQEPSNTHASRWWYNASYEVSLNSLTDALPR
jgi:hypothetical protein